MFKKGDKVVCKSASFIIINDTEKNPVYNISENKIYTVNNPDGGGNDISLYETGDIFYHKSRFMRLEELRFKKLKKLKNILYDRTL